MNPITDKLKIYLQDWAVHFIRSKDVIAKKIADIAQNAEDVDILVNFNDGKKQAIIVAPLLDVLTTKEFTAGAVRSPIPIDI